MTPKELAAMVESLPCKIANVEQLGRYYKTSEQVLNHFAAFAERYERMRSACKRSEELLVRRGDPFDGDDWEAVQDIRAAIAAADKPLESRT
jgi:hypothetical protein